jgi:hypothetical protein
MVGMNISFEASEPLSDILLEWEEELNFRLANIGIPYDRGKDIWACRDGDNIIVAANPILSHISEDEFPDYNIKIHLPYEGYGLISTVGGHMHPSSMTAPFPHLTIRIPYLIAVLDGEGELLIDGMQDEGGVRDYLYRSIADFHRKDVERMMEGFKRIVRHHLPGER